MRLIAKITALAALLLPSTVALAQKDKAQEIESILDRLEKRLIEQENQSLNFEEKDDAVGPQTGPITEPARKMKFKEEKISGHAKESERLMELATAIGELEEDIENLANDVQGTKQKVLENARVDNVVEIDAQLKDSDHAAIRTMVVKIDDYRVYSVDEAAGLWLPSKSIPLYSGPMQPGNHKIDIEANLVVRQGDAPINTDMFKTVSRSYAVVIPDGIVKKRWLLEFSVPEKSGSDAEATLTEQP